MRKCANKGCEVSCKLRFCDPCHRLHQSKLTNKCVRCAKKIPADKEYCQHCEVQSAKPNLCKDCQQTCRAGSVYCSDCRERYNATKEEKKDVDDDVTNAMDTLVLDKICEQCAKPSQGKYCEACREAYKKTLRPCADCGITETNAKYCDPCIVRYAAAHGAETTTSSSSSSRFGKCKDCGYKIAASKTFCSICIDAFKKTKPMNQCRTDSCTNRTAKIYCLACTTAFKASSSSQGGVY